MVVKCNVLKIGSFDCEQLQNPYIVVQMYFNVNLAFVGMGFLITI